MYRKRIVMIVLALIASSLAWTQGLGARLEPISSERAMALVRMAVNGLRVMSVDPAGLAADLGLRPDDVITDINGQKAERISDIPSSIDPSIGLSVTLVRNGQVRTLTLKPIKSSRLRVAFVGERDSDTFLALRNAGFEVEAMSRLPEQMNSYGVVVLEDERVCKPAIEPRLRAYLKNGGGLVLQKFLPQNLCTPDLLRSSDQNLQEISDWLGIAFMTDTYANEDPVAVVARSRPFEANLRRGDHLWQGRGKPKAPYFSKSAFDDLTIIIAEWLGGRLDRNDGCAAFAHEYGRGRVYYQFLPAWANYPKLETLFVAGVAWAAHARPNKLDGGLFRPQVPSHPDRLTVRRQVIFGDKSSTWQGDGPFRHRFPGCHA